VRAACLAHVTLIQFITLTEEAPYVIFVVLCCFAFSRSKHLPGHFLKIFSNCVLPFESEIKFYTHINQEIKPQFRIKHIYINVRTQDLHMSFQWKFIYRTEPFPRSQKSLSQSRNYPPTYGNWSFITVLKRTHNWTLPWSRWIQ